MSCWTLWQRMPPRYQLTMRDIRTDDQDTPQGMGVASRASSPTPRSPRLRSPRGTRHVGSARERLPRDGAMLTSGVLPEDYPTDIEYAPQNPLLPPRSSAYINNMKNQMRINSARRKMDEGTFVATSPTTLSYSPKPRATTAPAFPITKPSNTDEYRRITSPTHADSSPRPQDVASIPSHQLPQRLQRGFSGRRSPMTPSSGHGVRDTKRVSVSTLSPFGETRELRAEGQTTPLLHHPPSPTQQDCVIGDYQVAALYVDKGRVTFFRKTRPDMTQSVYSAISPYNVSREDGSYLSHLRKAYLTGVRDLPKMNRKQPDLEKHTTIRERMDYDRKVGRILDYYAKVDIPKEVHSPRPPEAQYLMQTSTSTAAQQGFRSVSSRRRGPRAIAMSEMVGSESGLSNNEAEFPSQRAPTVFPASRDQSQTQVPVREGGSFVRINAQARLHNRHHFYLRTPASQMSSKNQEVQQACGCACGMCRLEMEVALMAQLHRDLGVSVDAVAAAHIRSSLENNAIDAHNAALVPQTRQGPINEEDHCPARPNSVSDARHSAAPSVLPVSVNGEVESSTATDQHSSCDATMSVAIQTPSVPEATSLTVTLPVIEETGEVTHALQEGQAAESEMDEDGKAKETTNKTDFLEKLEQEPSNTVAIDDSTAAEEPVFADKHKQDSGASEDKDNERQSNNEYAPPTPAASNDSKTASDVENKSAEPNALKTQFIQEDSISNNCSVETAREPEANTLDKSNKSENSQSVEAENQSSTADLSDSNSRAVPEEKTGTTVQQSEDLATNASNETAPAEDTGSDAEKGENNVSHPPEIIISLASDTEDNMTTEQDIINQHDDTKQANKQEQ